MSRRAELDALHLPFFVIVRQDMQGSRGPFRSHGAAVQAAKQQTDPRRTRGVDSTDPLRVADPTRPIWFVAEVQAAVGNLAAQHDAPVWLTKVKDPSHYDVP